MGRRVHRDIVVRGTVYATVGDAAEGEGVSTGAVYKAMKAGTLDKLGTRHRGRKPEMPVRIRGVIYASAAEAAARLGCRVNNIYQQIARGRAERIGLGPEYNHAMSKQVAIGGLRFASMAQASRELGFGSSYVSQALRSGSRHAQQRILAAAMALAARREAAVRRAAGAATRRAA